jgi:tetratricopeptide (TPR) repeat protein
LNLDDVIAAGERFEQRLALERQLGNPARIAGALHALGIVAHRKGDDEAARSLYEESLALRRQIGDNKTGWTLLHRAQLVGDRGEVALARSLYEESLAELQEAGDLWPLAEYLLDFAEIARLQGDLAAARPLSEQGLAVSRQLGYKSSWPQVSRSTQRRAPLSRRV